MSKGWKREGYRHGLASKGIKTKADGCKKSMGIKHAKQYQMIMDRPGNKDLKIMFTNYLYRGERGGAYVINNEEVFIFNPQFDKGPDPPVAVVMNDELLGFVYSTEGVADILKDNGIKMDIRNDEEADLIFSKSKGMSEHEDGLEGHSWFGSGGDGYYKPKEFLKLLSDDDTNLQDYKDLVKYQSPYKMLKK